MESSRRMHTLFFLSLLPVALSLLTVAPFSAAAGQTADLSAGFAPNSIWVSRARITAGESVTLYTVLYNSSDTSFSGDAVFLVDGNSIGTKHFSINAGETETASVPWTATIGKHSIAARIEKPSNADTKQNATILNKTTDTITIEVAKPPPPPPPVPPSPTLQAAGAVVSALANGVSAAAPVVGSAAQKTYSATETLRKNMTVAIEKQLAKNPGSNAAVSYTEYNQAPTNRNTKTNAPASPATAARNGETATGKNTAPTGSDSMLASALASISSLPTLLSKVWTVFLHGALFILNSAVLFYLTLALTIFVVVRVFLFALRDRRPH